TTASGASRPRKAPSPNAQTGLTVTRVGSLGRAPATAGRQAKNEKASSPETDTTRFDGHTKPCQDRIECLDARVDRDRELLAVVIPARFPDNAHPIVREVR